ncbi:MAG: hypothetical protein IPI50_11315 [Saprospiraceae bacterium]|nr:hypothetical protein [Saprospiraceae bacterium]
MTGYSNYWGLNIAPKIRAIEGYPKISDFPGLPDITDWQSMNSWVE